MDTERLRELLGAATPGPWSAGYFSAGDKGSGWADISCEQDRLCVGYATPAAPGGEARRRDDETKANAALIVALRNNAEALLARLESAEKVVEAARKFPTLLQPHNDRDEHTKLRRNEQPVFGINEVTITLGDLRKLRDALAAHDKESR